LIFIFVDLGAFAPLKDRIRSSVEDIVLNEEE
jgi:hypothetical protein